MLKNYLVVALRNIKRHKVHSFINIAGLAIGMTCCLLILIFIIDELRYEQHHQNKDRIYRIAAELTVRDRVDRVAGIMPPLAPVLEEEYPEVENAVRFYPIRGAAIIDYGEQRFREENFYYVDLNVFDVFTFPLVKGNPKTALINPFSVVITEEIATKYFGQEDPLGKVLTYEDQYDFTVTGVLQTLPHHTQLRCEMMASFSSREAMNDQEIQSWGMFGRIFTYIQLTKDYSPKEFEQKLGGVIEKHVGEPLASMVRLWLQPLTDIYLHSNLMGELEPTGNIGYVYLFSALAGIILLIACINFMNLATARSTHRANEIGMRKVFGAHQSQLVKQFLGESILISFIALLLTVILFETILSWFSTFLGKELAIDIFKNTWIIPGLVGLVFFVGILAGSYPALFLSRFKTMNIIKSTSLITSRAMLRKLLVVFQFTISVILIFGTLIIYKQLDFVKNENLGFNKDYLISIPLENPIRPQYNSLKNILLQNPEIANVSGALSIPASGPTMALGVAAEGVPEDDPVIMQIVATDFDYLSTLGIDIILGRNFSEEFATDATEAFILNQTAVKRLGWENPIGKQFTFPDVSRPGSERTGKVIGVVKDFHMRSLRERIEPMVLYINPVQFSTMAVRIQSGNISETLNSIEQTWQKFVPNTPIEYSFVDEKFAEFYQTEERLGQIVSYFSLLAVFIACLGLFGLASFTTEQRSKEVGIRKVLGASVSGIIMLLSREFINLVLIANVIAIPVAWYAMNRWLQNFAYRINIEIWSFILASAIALMIALCTVSFQAIKAAIANPVESLKYE